ncbi:MAG: PEP/pyruvate-binding domain-containing protein [Candidatus Cloacimonadota bacterium]
MDTIDSKALSQNLEITKVHEIVMDEEALHILEISQAQYGIHQRAELFLEELFHPFVNPDICRDLMRQSVLGDLWFFAGHEDKLRIISALISYYERLWSLCISQKTGIKLIDDYLEFTQALISYPMLLEGHFETILNMLQEWRREAPRLFIESSSQLKRALLKVNSAHQSEAALDLVCQVLQDNLLFWENTADLSSWAGALAGSSSFDINYQDLKQDIQSKRFEDVPAFSELAIWHRDRISEIKSSVKRVHFIIFLLSLPGMHNMMDHLLWDLNRQLAGLFNKLERSEQSDLLDSVFKTLKGLQPSHPGIVLDCMETIAKAILSENDPGLTKELMQFIVDLGFSAPGKIGIDKNWQIVVDKNHVKHLRILLELIALNPLQNKDLVAFTVISLTREGVFIADTDFFQKDVSAFLNAKLKPIYVQSKHLLRLFPVFYNEIGAEGEIRDTSTSLDELCQREDRLIHFLRKQIHTESNNTHIRLIERILQYWIDLNPEPLRDLLPLDVWAYVSSPDSITQKQSQATRDFLDSLSLTTGQLLNLSWQKVESFFPKDSSDVCLKRLRHLAYCHFLLKDKYNLDPYDVVKFLAHYPFFKVKEQNRLRMSLIRRDYDSSIRQMLNYIGLLNATVLDPKPSEAWENIYYKRHIAAGIPSMYGSYKEPKLEAMGMIFRLENVIRRLFENSIAQLNLEYINGKTLKRIIRILELYDFAMRQERVTSDAFGSALDMLISLERNRNASLDQYMDIFKLLKDSVNEIINEYYYRFYDSELRQIFKGEKDRASRERFAEEFYRELLSKSFLVQGLDGFITHILESLSTMTVLFSPQDVQKLMNYDPDTLFFHLSSKNSRIENQVLLGSKAYYLKRMHQYEFPIPTGFVLTTDLFRNRDIVNKHPDISAEFDRLLGENLEGLELETGLKFGDPHKPLLLSVRSGAPMSLPGAMDTFLNIGLNDEITLGLSRMPNYGWTAWDCYRRLIQSWGMAHGIPRDEFDQVMLDHKQRFNVNQKTQFTDEQMRSMVDDYKAVLAVHRVCLEQNPFRQIYLAISHVLDSWNTERARIYRAKLHISEHWGTAVIVQKMVMGNISLESGSGVLFTHADWNPESGICLNGDFTICSQGEDVVAGLVHTLPISEAQRLQSASETELSLEKDFPAIYNRVHRIATQLIQEKNYPHQEIEFTFEGKAEDQLYILQTRNQVIQKVPDYQVLGAENEILSLLASGIGIGKGALNGIIVMTAQDIQSYKQSSESLILVRPDTAPDDIPLLFECQGLLTSRGGVTSHAAVTATRLGLIGVVNCRDMVVLDSQALCTIGGTILRAGDKIALDATSGKIYLGHYQLQSVHYYKQQI